ncbi:MAG: sigma-54-dependent Fis family transcriptional regulator [Calditrichaeota bacterium]|nr:sigma-54-dependent Fis family transcriptional regulator [Spirochaetales bacterium]RQW04862.1 MAG: sigma-54-dependent Fis family transcriptional regulator [Calditrichota bacterium]
MTNIYISWIAYNKDDPEKSDGKYGPTLSVLLGKDSEYSIERKKYKSVYLLHQDDKKGQRVFEYLKNQIARESKCKVENILYKETDPTDHQKIFKFIKSEVFEKVQCNRDQNHRYFIHISPGTASMHSVWVLMHGSAMIENATYIKSHTIPGENIVIKPVNLEVDSIYQVFRKDNTLYKNQEDSVFIDPLRVKSDKLQEIYRKASRFADLKIPLLILGEKGTGKSTLANWIRSNSRYRQERNDGNWASIACGQFSENLLESELFGHAKGAFTGADKEKAGLLEKAHKDTLFLDEIGDMSLNLQRKIIKSIEDGTYTPVGGTDTRKSKFRLISATNKNMNELKETLSGDFYDRVSYLVLEQPPLRDILDDLEIFWDQIWKNACSRADVERPELSASDKKELFSWIRRQPLKGNFRDLYQIAYTIIAFSNKSSIADIRDVFKELKPVSDSETLSVSEKDMVKKMMEPYTVDNTVRTAEVIAALKREMAIILRERAKAEDVNVNEICDVTGRSLSDWRKMSS